MRPIHTDHCELQLQMCGIAFYALLDAQKKAHADAFAACGETLRHRGPDGSRTRVRDHDVMVFHRLAIINIGAEGAEGVGMQPFDSEDGKTVVCNGEIYNYRDLCPHDAMVRSDVDAVLCVLSNVSLTEEDQVTAAIARLDGDFALVVTQGPLFCAARDHVGVRPLFYATDCKGRVFAFASEAKALHGAPGVAEVRPFPPGRIFFSSSGRFAPFVFPPEPSHHGFEEAATRVRALLTRAVEKRLEHSERPVAVLCSGGVDSSVITALASSLRHAQRKPLEVFTMEFAEGLSEDAFYARLLCERLGLPLTTVRFSREEIEATIEKVIAACESPDPNTVRAAVPMFLLAKYIAENSEAKVVLSGEGADELFAGYNYFRFGNPAEVKEETRRLLRNLHAFDLLRADRCFAAFGLEVRVPFLDRDLVAAVQGLPAETLVPKGPKGGSGEKLLLRAAFAEEEALREGRIIDRPKERFSDGCGFSYVPALLNIVSRGEEAALDRKLARETTWYAALFAARFPGLDAAHLVVARELPEWTHRAGGKGCVSFME